MAIKEIPTCPCRACEAVRDAAYRTGIWGAELWCAAYMIAATERADLLPSYQERAWRAESLLSVRVALRREVEELLGMPDRPVSEEVFAEGVERLRAAIRGPMWGGQLWCACWMAGAAEYLVTLGGLRGAGRRERVSRGLGVAPWWIEDNQ